MYVADAAQAQSLTGEALAAQIDNELLNAKAPALTLRRLDGEALDLASIYGKKPIYLKFWASWCQPCLEQMRHFESVQSNADGDLVVIGVNLGISDTQEDVRRVRERYGLTMPLAVDDGSAATAFHVRVTPMHVIIGRDGFIRHVGHPADAALASALRAVQGVTPVGPLSPRTASPAS